MSVDMDTQCIDTQPKKRHSHIGDDPGSAPHVRHTVVAPQPDVPVPAVVAAPHVLPPVRGVYQLDLLVLLGAAQFQDRPLARVGDVVGTPTQRQVGRHGCRERGRQGMSGRVSECRSAGACG